MDDRMLADIGLTRSDLRDAYAEPLWRDPTDVLAGRARDKRRVSPKPGRALTIDVLAVARAGRTQFAAAAETVDRSSPISERLTEPALPSRPGDPQARVSPRTPRIQAPARPSPAGALLSCGLRTAGSAPSG